MGNFFEKLRGLEERKRKVVVWVMSAAAMIVVVIIWIAYMWAVSYPAQGVDEKKVGVVPLFGRAAESLPRNAGLWISGAASYIFGHREVVIEK